MVPQCVTWKIGLMAAGSEYHGRVLDLLGEYVADTGQPHQTTKFYAPSYGRASSIRTHFMQRLLTIRWCRRPNQRTMFSEAAWRARHTSIVMLPQMPSVAA